MVDDIADIQKCGTDALLSNAAINSFVEHKKLTLNAGKCHKIHCGAKRSTCPNLKIHKQNMHETDEEKYLGDHINKYGKHGSTIAKRRARGFGIISDIIQIIESIPDGRRRVQIGLHLRQSWFINSMFVNIEVWHNVLKKDIDTLIDLDKYLMKKILNAH